MGSRQLTRLCRHEAEVQDREDSMRRTGIVIGMGEPFVTYQHLLHTQHSSKANLFCVEIQFAWHILALAQRNSIFNICRLHWQWLVSCKTLQSSCILMSYYSCSKIRPTVARTWRHVYLVLVVSISYHPIYSQVTGPLSTSLPHDNKLLTNLNVKVRDLNNRYPVWVSCVVVSSTYNCT